MPYFECVVASGGATLEVSYEEDFYGKTITVTNGSKTLVKTASSSGSVSFNIPESGLWTISGTVNGNTYSTDVNVSLEYFANLTAGFNYKAWLVLAALDPESYSSLSDVLSDELAVRRLMTVHASSDYLIEAVTEDIDVIDDFVANDIAMKWIGLRDYVCDGLTAIAGVEAKFLASQYWERYLKDHVPTMTANNAPYGVASATNNGTDAWRAFNGTNESGSTDAWGGSGLNIRLVYEFPTPICVKEFEVTNRNNSTLYAMQDFTLQGSNDGVTWTDLGNYTKQDGIANKEKFSTSNNDYFKMYGIYVTSVYDTSSAKYSRIGQLQFYGRSLNVSVPVMTSNTAPYGEVITDTTYNSTNVYKSFDNNISDASVMDGVGSKYLGYKFTSNVHLKRFKLVDKTNQYHTLTYKLQASEDGTTYSDVAVEDTVTTSGGYSYRFGDIDIDAKIIRFIPLTTTPNSAGTIPANSYAEPCIIQFYGVDYSEREFEPNSGKKWLYDHGLELEPISEAITTGGTITFGDDFVTIDRTAQANLSIATDSAIDLANYNKLFAIVDTTKGSSIALIGCANTRDSNVSSMTGNKIVTSVGSYVKDCLDISAIDNEQYPIVNANNTGTFNLKELWFEQ